MPATGIRVGNTGLRVGNFMFGVGADAPSSRTWKLMSSTKLSFGDTNTAQMLAFPAVAPDVIAGGTTRYRGLDLHMGGHINDAGKLVSLPDDPAITEVRSFDMFALNMDDLGTYYEGETLVLKVVEGSLGAGNSLSIAGSGLGAANVINATPTAYRVEKEITSGASFDDINARVSLTDPAAYTAAGGAVWRLCLKSQEADADDVVNNPYKAWAPGFRAWLSHFDILRSTDWTLPMNCAQTHIKDMGRVTDPVWFGQSEAYAADGDWQVNNPLGRQGAPMEAWLDLCENGPTAGGPQEAWFAGPCWLNSAVRKTGRSYVNDTPTSGRRTYYVDGVQQTRALSDFLFWIDKSWADISSLSISAQPSNGVATIENNGTIVYNPAAGGSPYTHTSGEQEAQITLGFNQIDYDGSNNASVGSPETFIAPVRVIYWGSAGKYLCRVKGGAIWPLNKTFMSAAARWQSNARDFVDRLVASGYSTTRPLYYATGNETWNGAGRFEADKVYCQGVASAYDAEWAAWQSSTGASTALSRGKGGAGILSAFLRYYVEQELSNRGLSYNIIWVADAQIVDSESGRAMAQGHRFALESIFGIAPATVQTMMQKFGVGGAYYPSGSLINLATRTGDNLTGLSGAANDTEILDRFDGTASGYAADGSTLDAEILNWTTKAEADQLNTSFMLQQEAIQRAAVEDEGGVWLGAYEDGDHDDGAYGGSPVSSALVNATRTNSTGKTFPVWDLEQREGARGGAIVRDKMDRRIAAQPNTILCQYGGQYRKTYGEPWSTGWWQLPPTEEVIALREYGRLA